MVTGQRNVSAYVLADYGSGMGSIVKPPAGATPTIFFKFNGYFPTASFLGTINTTSLSPLFESKSQESILQPLILF